MEEKKKSEQLTEEQLEQQLKELQEKKRKAAELKRIKYESQRGALVNDLYNRAVAIEQAMRDFKSYAYQRLEAFRAKAEEMQDIRSNSKGGFSLRNNAGDKLIRLARRTRNEWDERADMGYALIKDFLTDMVKKRDHGAYEFIMSLLQRNKAGDYEPAMISKLLQQRNRYSDDRWHRAMDLFAEAYREREIAFSIEVYRRADDGKDMPVLLNISAIRVDGMSVQVDDTQDNDNKEDKEVGDEQ